MLLHSALSSAILIVFHFCSYLSIWLPTLDVFFVFFLKMFWHQLSHFWLFLKVGTLDSMDSSRQRNWSAFLSSQKLCDALGLWDWPLFNAFYRVACERLCCPAVQQRKLYSHLSAPDVPQTSLIVHRILNLYISQKEIAFCSVDEACVATCDFFKPGLDGSVLSIKRPANSILLSNTHTHLKSLKWAKMFSNSQTCTFISQKV